MTATDPQRAEDVERVVLLHSRAFVVVVRPAQRGIVWELRCGVNYGRNVHAGHERGFSLARWSMPGDRMGMVVCCWFNAWRGTKRIFGYRRDRAMSNTMLESGGRRTLQVGRHQLFWMPVEYLPRTLGDLA